jgi:hypothetical protein
MLQKEVNGNKISRYHFNLRQVANLWQDYTLPEKSATVPDQGTPYQVPSVNSVKLQNVKKVKLKTLAFYAKNEFVALVLAKLKIRCYCVHCITGTVYTVLQNSINNC